MIVLQTGTARTTRADSQGKSRKTGKGRLRSGTGKPVEMKRRKERSGQERAGAISAVQHGKMSKENTIRVCARFEVAAKRDTAVSAVTFEGM